LKAKLALFSTNPTTQPSKPEYEILTFRKFGEINSNFKNLSEISLSFKDFKKTGVYNLQESRMGGNKICTFGQKWGTLFVVRDFCKNIAKIKEFLKDYRTNFQLVGTMNGQKA
jgi:hypothetical protein